MGWSGGGRLSCLRQRVAKARRCLLSQGGRAAPGPAPGSPWPPSQTQPLPTRPPARPHPPGGRAPVQGAGPRVPALPRGGDAAAAQDGSAGARRQGAGGGEEMPWAGRRGAGRSGCSSAARRGGLGVRLACARAHARVLCSPSPLQITDAEDVDDDEEDDDVEYINLGDKLVGRRGGGGLRGGRGSTSWRGVAGALAQLAYRGSGRARGLPPWLRQACPTTHPHPPTPTHPTPTLLIPTHTCTGRDPHVDAGGEGHGVLHDRVLRRRAEGGFLPLRQAGVGWGS
jgi:hypothetical protein